jgi:RNA polymerase sigma factor (sigma-70 family)
MTTLTAQPPPSRPWSTGPHPGTPTRSGSWVELRLIADIIFELFAHDTTRHSLARRHLMINDSTPSVYTRQSLLERLKDWDDSASWKVFFETYWRLIFAVARRSGLTEAEAQDVVQETIIAVAKKMPDFHYDRTIGTFKGYLMHLTRSRIADHFRRKTYQIHGERRPKEAQLDPEVLANQPDLGGIDLEAVWEHEWKVQLLEAAMDRVRERSKARQFQMFQLHVCKGLPAKEVATRLKVKLPEVYFAKYKISAAIKREAKRLEKSMI